uniref:AMP-dependent synthetase/ligase domain-containing protein n=1 Tax=Lactuca sativa TaxID=4236 RepID=A0A9R1WRU8_LACSA|nr:hypothetical protein LSAT_V11C100006910 [Lactuca sativa]
MVYKSLDSIDSSDIVELGIPSETATQLHQELTQIIQSYGPATPQTWNQISTRLLNPDLPFSFHQMMYYGCYKDFGPDPPAWLPDPEEALLTNIGSLLERRGKEFLGPNYKDPITSYSTFHEFSASNLEVFWKTILVEMNISFSVPPKAILVDDPSEETQLLHPGGRWLPGAYVNPAGNCLSLSSKRISSDIAVIWRNEGDDETPVNTMTFEKLLAYALGTLGLEKGSAIAIDMPMDVNSVVIYLAIILAGHVVVSIADSFAPTEISTRLVLSKAKAIFTQVLAKVSIPMWMGPLCLVVTCQPLGRPHHLVPDLHLLGWGPALRLLLQYPYLSSINFVPQDLIIRGERSIPLYSRVVDAQSPMAIVIPTRGSGFSMKLRDGDISWHDFLEQVKINSQIKIYRNVEFVAVERPVEEFSNILFSSGTTGEPKAIPWTLATPFKAGADGWCHMDIRKGDVVAWPTNLGWMMGPWLVYASLLNGASLALYNGAPLGSGFAKFVQDAKVTMLGVIPSIVRAWRTNNCTAGFDWSTIRCFGSTGEASSVDEYLWLMGRAKYKPVIEYCGGTEIGGGFITGSLLHPQCLSAFSTPSLGCNLFILDQNGIPMPPNVPGVGELALNPLMFGASSTLLNANHYDVYFKGMPSWNGKVLRRHGDVFELTSRGYYRAHGRADDTMNLGGIKA